MSRIGLKPIAVPAGVTVNVEEGNKVTVKGALGTLTDGAYATIADVTAMVDAGDEEVTPNKVSYRLSQLVKAGVAESTDVKVPATETSKARTIKAYKLV